MAMFSSKIFAGLYTCVAPNGEEQKAKAGCNLPLPQHML